MLPGPSKQYTVSAINSLIASALLATIAFLVAGRIATMTLEIDSCLEQDMRYHEIFSNNPEYFEDVDFRLFFFNSTYATGHDYYLVNMKGDVINATRIENRNISNKDQHTIVPNLNSFNYEYYN